MMVSMSGPNEPALSDGPMTAVPANWNPLFDFHRQNDGRATARDMAIRRYGFAIPTSEALSVIVDRSPAGVVEIGAGTGYWAKLLQLRGADAVAYDIDPPPSATNAWHAGRKPWHPVRAANHEVVVAHRDRTLLLVWPTRNETWPADTIELFHRAGGRNLVYVGEGPGGRSGDDRFHALLGAIDHCYACQYDLSDAICTCTTPVLWAWTESVEIPRWEGFDDRLHVYEATQPSAPLRRRLPRSSRHRGRR
jgi:SAM-dependent methyltransferase